MPGEGGQTGLRLPPVRPQKAGDCQTRDAEHAQHRPQHIKPLHLPNVLIGVVESIVKAGAPIGAQLDIGHRILPDGHVDGHIRHVLPGGEVLVSGDIPQGILCVEPAAVHVHQFPVLPDLDLAVAEDQMKVVSLRQLPAAGDLRARRDIAVEQLIFRADDLIEQILIRRIVCVRRGAVLGGDILRGGVRGSPGVPSVAAPGQDVGVPGSGIPPVQVAAGGHGQERLQPLGHLPPKGWSFLPVGTPPARAEGAAVRAAGQAARRLSQAPQHQADAQHQRQQPGRRPQLPGGLSRDLELHHAGGVLRPLQSLPDLTGHKLLQTLVRSRAVPFCIQFPTPP